MDDSRRTWRVATVVAVAAATVAGAWSWVPSAWSDEAATVTAATRSFGQLSALVFHVDMVHATHYVLMHGWFALVGVHDWSLRLPSVVALAVAVLGTVVLGRRLASLRVGALAGVLLALVPQSLWAATEARYYTLAMAIAVWLALVLVVAAEDGRARWWVLFGVLAAALVAVFIFAALVVVALGVSVLAVRAWRRRWRSFAVAAGAAALVSAPLAYEVLTQRWQVAWMTKPSADTVGDILGFQWFGGQVQFDHSGAVRLALTAVFWVLVGAAVVHAIRVHRGRAAGTAGDTDPVPLVGLALPWLVVPTAGLVVVSFVTPVYTPRYVTFSAPAIALLAALTLARLRPGWRVAVLAVVVALVAPSYVAQRQVGAKGTEWSVVAATIAAGAQPGDGFLVIDHGPDQELQGVRAILRVYPQETAGLVDVALDRTAAEAGRLEDSLVPTEELAGRLAGHDRLWLVTAPAGLAWADTDEGRLLADQGYTEAQHATGRWNDVLLLTRS